MQEISFNSEEEYVSFFNERKQLTICCLSSNSCGFCAKESKALGQLEKIFNTMALTSDDKKIDIFDINTDQTEMNTEIADNLNADILPTQIFIRDGKIIEINDPRFKSAPYILQSYYSTAQLKKIVNYLVNNPQATDIGKSFFSQVCSSCKNMTNHGRNYCKKHHIKIQPNDVCPQFKRNIKYKLH